MDGRPGCASLAQDVPHVDPHRLFRDVHHRRNLFVPQTSGHGLQDAVLSRRQRAVPGPILQRGRDTRRNRSCAIYTPSNGTDELAGAQEAYFFVWPSRFSASGVSS